MEATINIFIEIEFWFVFGQTHTHTQPNRHHTLKYRIPIEVLNQLNLLCIIKVIMHNEKRVKSTKTNTETKDTQKEKR